MPKVAMQTSYDILLKRLEQLENRKHMIPIYVKKPGSFIGKKDFSLDDIPGIEKEIEETIAAINGIKLIRKLNKPARCPK